MTTFWDEAKVALQQDEEHTTTTVWIGLDNGQAIRVDGKASRDEMPTRRTAVRGPKEPKR